MANCLSFLTHALYGTFYSYLDTSTVGALCEVNKDINENITTYVKDCQKRKRKPFPRSSYFEDKKGNGFICYTRYGYKTTCYEGAVWDIKASPFNPDESTTLIGKLIYRNGAYKDLYRLTTYNVYGQSGMGHYMSKDEALDICESFRWWYNRKVAHNRKMWREEEARALAEAERKKKTFPLRTSAKITNPWKKV